MQLLNVHERLVRLSANDAFAELEALGTAQDKLWPNPKMPFLRTPGPMKVGTTRERHGIIAARLAEYRPNGSIVWRADQSFLHGTHGFELVAAEHGHTRVRHTLRAQLAWWFAPIWRLKIERIHDRLIEQLFDRLEACAAAPPPARKARASHVDAARLGFDPVAFPIA